MGKTGDGSSEKPAAKSFRTNARNRDNDRKNDNYNKDDDSSTTSSSSSEGSELRLEFERLSRERNKQLRKNEKNQLLITLSQIPSSNHCVKLIRTVLTISMIHSKLKHQDKPFLEIPLPKLITKERQKRLHY